MKTKQNSKNMQPKFHIQKSVVDRGFRVYIQLEPEFDIWIDIVKKCVTFSAARKLCTILGKLGFTSGTITRNSLVIDGNRLKAKFIFSSSF